MEKTTQLSVTMENIPGQLGRLCRILSQANLNIRGITVADSTDVSTIRLCVSNPTAAKTCLREAGVHFTTQDVLVVEVDDKPGALERVAARLGDAGVNVQYVYGTGDCAGSKARMVMRVSDVDLAKQALA
jgi:hypothetical protein